MKCKRSQKLIPRNKGLPENKFKVFYQKKLIGKKFRKKTILRISNEGFTRNYGKNFIFRIKWPLKIFFALFISRIS